MDARRQTPLGEDIESWQPGFQIAGLRIDNPSGSWLHVETLNRYVPPYTLEYRADFIPSTTSLTIRFTDSPTGTPSELVGEPIVVQAFDTPQGFSQGYPSGGAHAQAPGVPKALISVATPAVPPAELGSVLTTLVLGSQSFKIVPLKLYLAPRTFESGPGLSYQELRAMVVTEIRDLAGINFLAPALSISPESPFAALDFPPGLVLPTGEPLRATSHGQVGAGYQGIAISTLYYEQAV